MNRSFDQDLHLHGLYCKHPYQTITIDSEGDVYSCFCQAWVPVSIGKIWEFSSIDEINDNQKRRQIINSIEDGSYRYCDSINCNMITGKELTTVKPFDKIYTINFCIDESCNLTCPSCRTSFKFIDESDVRYSKRISMVESVIKLIENYKYPLNFNISGDGDPFASLIYRHFISKLNLEDKTNVTLDLMTNGILIKDHWHKISKIHKNINSTKITFDAGTAEVYSKTRRGGSWNKLLESVKFLVQWKKENQSDMLIIGNYVVQAENYFDMKNYVNLCTELGMDAINFQRIENWYTFSDFSSENIFDKSHPKHQDFLTVLRDPLFSSNKINLTNLQTLRDEII